MSFGDTLSSFRKHKYRLTQKQVAEEAKLHDSYISLLERGMRECPSRGTVLNIARAMNMEPDDRNALMVAAGYAPDSLGALLFEPKLAELDDLLSHIGNEDLLEDMRRRINEVYEYGQTLMVDMYGSLDGSV